MDQIGNVHVLANGMEEVVPSLGVAVTVAADGKHGQVAVRQFAPVAVGSVRPWSVFSTLPAM